MCEVNFVETMVQDVGEPDLFAPITLEHKFIVIGLSCMAGIVLWWKIIVFLPKSTSFLIYHSTGLLGVPQVKLNVQVSLAKSGWLLRFACFPPPVDFESNSELT